MGPAKLFPGHGMPNSVSRGWNPIWQVKNRPLLYFSGLFILCPTHISADQPKHQHVWQGGANPKGQIATTFFLSYVTFKTTVISISVCVMWMTRIFEFAHCLLQPHFESTNQVKNRLTSEINSLETICLISNFDHRSSKRAWWPKIWRIEIQFSKAMIL